ncbi:hypothetical protein SRHO_G00147480 [Serrasalmus rhombeus]
MVGWGLNYFNEELKPGRQQPSLPAHRARLVHQTGTAFAILLISKKQDNMSDTAKDTVTPKDKDGAEKRGRGRPRKHPQEPSGSPTPKRPRGRPKGSKNKAGSTAPKGKKAAAATASAGGKRRGRPKKAVSSAFTWGVFSLCSFTCAPCV